MSFSARSEDDTFAYTTIANAKILNVSLSRRIHPMIFVTLIYWDIRRPKDIFAYGFNR